MGDAPALARPVIEMLELDAEDRALDSFHAIIVTHFLVVIAFARTVFAQGTGARGHLRVVGDERTPFAVIAKIFTRVTATARQRAKGPVVFAFFFCPMRLSGIFDQGQMMFLTDLEQ